MNYFLSAILLVVSIFTFIIGVNYFIKARVSVLYSSVSRVSIFASIYSILYLVNIYYPLNKIALIKSVLLAIIVYTTFSLWRITYNQISNKTYTFFISLLILSQLIIDISVFNNVIVNNFIMIFSKFSLIYVFIYILTIFNFYNDRNLNKLYEFNFIPLILAIFIMSLLTSVLTVGNMNILFNILQITAYLLLSLVYYKDYKLSLYF